MYFLLIDRFHDGKERNAISSTVGFGDHEQLKVRCGGTIKGITKQLGYISEMGFTSVWINPFLQNNFDYIMSCVKMESINRSFRRKIMSSRGIFILAITWIVMSPFWFWAENIALGIIWLCGGVIELFIALVRRSKEKKSK